METFNSMQRVLISLSHREADRVPFFLLFTTHGAKELEMSIRDYFSNAENVAEGQIRLQRKYRHDCLYAFWYAALEAVAWGGETVWHDEAPPNAGQHPIDDPERLIGYKPPVVAQTQCLQPPLDAIRRMKARVGDSIPIIGVVMSPFSLPVMQIGFDRYLEILYERPDLFQSLMQMNSEFCVEWANSQLAAGATAICYFDPLASPAIIPREIYQVTGFKVARETLARIKGPTATHLASGRALGIMDMLPLTGTAAVGVCCDEDLEILKKTSHNSVTLLGNLNGIAMRNWTRDETFRHVRDAIRKAAPGGGFILSDHHGEIPYQVPDEVLMAISDAVHEYGTYPLTAS